MGLLQSEIARRLGKSQTAISNLVMILEAPEAVKEMIQNKEISATLAAEEMKSDPENAEIKITKAVQKAKDSGKSRATKKDIEEDVDIIPKKCPFCGEKLVEIDDLEHPLNSCILEGFAFGLDKLKAWNRRSK